MALNIREMEQMALDLRADLGIKTNQKLNPLKISIDGVRVITLDDLPEINLKTKEYLLGEGCKQWSAMSVPLDEDFQDWVIVRNHEHEIARQSASIMEEFWHILLGHELTKIVKFGSHYGRSFESDEEHDAYYLASASLAPRDAVKSFVEKKGNLAEFANSLGVSPELIEYRIKRLGLWREYRPKTISYGDE